MQITPLTWKTMGQHSGFPCFTRGCGQNAEYVVKVKRGEVVIQLCLCGKCLRHCPSAILEDIRQNDGGFKTTHIDQPKNKGCKLRQPV